MGTLWDEHRLGDAARADLSHYDATFNCGLTLVMGSSFLDFTQDQVEDFACNSVRIELSDLC